MAQAELQGMVAALVGVAKPAEVSFELKAHLGDTHGVILHDVLAARNGWNQGRSGLAHVAQRQRQR